MDRSRRTSAQPSAEERGYKAGTVTVASLIQAVPELEDLAQTSGERILNIFEPDHE